jgi:hypothetical protein
MCKKYCFGSAFNSDLDPERLTTADPDLAPGPALPSQKVEFLGEKYAFSRYHITYPVLDNKTFLRRFQSLFVRMEIKFDAHLIILVS